MKICDLIFHLIDWNELGMQVVAVAHDGFEALQLIREKTPDIVITDIRMPGYNGVELIRLGKKISSNMNFIIISGYSQFEYAKEAVHYGAIDYLLKPIKRNELFNVLVKLKKRYEENENINRAINEGIKLAESNKKAVRKQLILNAFYKRNTNEFSDIRQVNEKYKYTFKEGWFDFVMIKISTFNSPEEMIDQFVFDKISQSISFHMEKAVYDFESVNIHQGLFAFVVNYNSVNGKDIDEQLKEILNQLYLQKNIFNGFHFCIGKGEPVNTITKLDESCTSAYYQTQQSLIKGSDRIISGCNKDHLKTYPAYFVETASKIEQALSNFNSNQLIGSIRNFALFLHQDDKISGYDIIQMTKALMNTIIVALQKNEYGNPTTNYIDNFSNVLENCFTINELIKVFERSSLDLLNKYKAQKEMEDNRPIREAKKYIQDNLASDITLKDVSEHVGYNTSYFSSMFKKECNMTFSEYLTESRINESKKLLKSSNDTIEAIAHQCGYTDIKTFNKNFKKYVGLKPGQYRKIYG